MQSRTDWPDYPLASYSASPTRIKSLYVDGTPIHNKDRSISCLLAHDDHDADAGIGKDETASLRFIVAARNFTAAATPTTATKQPRKLGRGTITAAWHVRGEQGLKGAAADRNENADKEDEHDHSPAKPSTTSQPFSFIDLDLRSIRSVRAVSNERRRTNGKNYANAKDSSATKLRGSASVTVDVYPGTRMRGMDDAMVEVRDGLKLVFFSVKNAMAEKDRIVREIEWLKEMEQQQRDEEEEEEPPLKRSRKCSSSGVVKLVDAEDIVDDVQSQSPDDSVAATAVEKSDEHRSSYIQPTPAEDLTAEHGLNHRDTDAQFVQGDQRSQPSLPGSPQFTQKEQRKSPRHGVAERQKTTTSALARDGHVVSSSFFSSSPPNEASSRHNSILQGKAGGRTEKKTRAGDSNDVRAMGKPPNVTTPQLLSDANNVEADKSPGNGPVMAKSTSPIKQRLRGKKPASTSSLQPAQSHSESIPPSPIQGGRESCDRDSGARQNRRGDADTNNTSTSSSNNDNDNDNSTTATRHGVRSFDRQPDDLKTAAACEAGVECIPDSQGLLLQHKGVQGLVDDNPGLTHLNFEQRHNSHPAANAVAVTPPSHPRQDTDTDTVVDDITMAEKTNTNPNTDASASASNGGKLKRPSHKLAPPTSTAVVTTSAARGSGKRSTTNWDLDAFGDETEPIAVPTTTTATAANIEAKPKTATAVKSEKPWVAGDEGIKHEALPPPPPPSPQTAGLDATTGRSNNKTTTANVEGAKRGRGRPRGSVNRGGRAGRGGRGGTTAAAAASGGRVLPLTPVTATASTEKVTQRKDAVGGANAAAAAATESTAKKASDSSTIKKKTADDAASTAPAAAPQRSRRGAAERAMKEIAKEREIENARDDPDDPIESSIPEDKHLRAAAVVEAKKLDVTNDYENEADDNDDDDGSAGAPESDSVYNLTPRSPKKDEPENTQMKQQATDTEKVADAQEQDVICISDSEAGNVDQDNKPPPPSAPAQPSFDLRLVDSPLSPPTASRSTVSQSGIGLGKRLRASLYNSGLFTTSSSSPTQFTSPSSVEDDHPPTTKLAKTNPAAPSTSASPFLTRNKGEKRHTAPKQAASYGAEHARTLLDGDTTLVDDIPAFAPTAHTKDSVPPQSGPPRSILSTAKKPRGQEHDKDTTTTEPTPLPAGGDGELQKKVQVVSFDTTGPRNQGTVSARRRQQLQQQQKVGKVYEDANSSATAKEKARIAMSASFAHTGRMQSQVDENGSPMPLGARKRESERGGHGGGNQSESEDDMDSENNNDDDEGGNSGGSWASSVPEAYDESESDAAAPTTSFTERRTLGPRQSRDNPFAVDTKPSAIPQRKEKEKENEVHRDSATTTMTRSQKNDPASWRHNGRHIHVERTKSGMPIFVTSTIAKPKPEADAKAKHYGNKWPNIKADADADADAPATSELTTEDAMSRTDSVSGESDNEDDATTLLSDVDSTATTSVAPGDSLEDVEDAEATWKSALRESHLTTLDIMTDINQVSCICICICTDSKKTSSLTTEYKHSASCVT